MKKGTHDIAKVFALIDAERRKMSEARTAAQQYLTSIEKQLIGRRFTPSRLGNLKGEYEITDVDLEYDGQVKCHGRKVTTSGKLGNQRWDLGRIWPERIGLS